MINALIEKVENTAKKKELPKFFVGDTVSVQVRIVEGGKERIQPFIGVVIGRRGRGMGESFTVRRIVNNEGVECHREPLLRALVALLDPAGILLRGDSRSRREAGLSLDPEHIHHGGLQRRTGRGLLAGDDLDLGRQFPLGSNKGGGHQEKDQQQEHDIDHARHGKLQTLLTGLSTAEFHG